MLRIVVIALIVANLVLFGFEISKPGQGKNIPESLATSADPGIPTIHLFAELQDDAGLMGDSRRCLTLGPFHSIEDMEAFRGQIQLVATTISERQTQALVEKGYWVFMPPYASLLEANQALLSLQALGLKDIGVIYEGERANAISLGYFLRRENALIRKQSLEARGYEPHMQVQRQAEPHYWLDYEQSPGSTLPTLDMHNRPNDFMQRTMPCAVEKAPAASAIESMAQADEAPQAEAGLTGDTDEGPAPGETSVPDSHAAVPEDGDQAETGVSDEATVIKEVIPPDTSEVLPGSEGGATDEGENGEVNTDKRNDDLVDSAPRNDNQSDDIPGDDDDEPAADDG